MTLDLGPLPAGTMVQFDLDDGSQYTWRAASGDGWLSAADHRIHLGLGSREVVAIRLAVPGEEPRPVELPSSFD